MQLKKGKVIKTFPILYSAFRLIIALFMVIQENLDNAKRALTG